MLVSVLAAASAAATLDMMTVASTTTLGGLRSALAAHLGIFPRDGLAIRRRGTAVPPTQDHLPASTYFGSYDDAVVLD